MNAVPSRAVAHATDASRELRDTLGRFATGVAVVATRDRLGRPVGLTVNSFSSVSLDPPLVSWCLSLASGLLPDFVEAPGYAISVLSRQQSLVARRFAQRCDDRFTGVPWAPDRNGAPLLEGAIAHLSCAPYFTERVGDHLMLVGRVVHHASWAGEPLLFYGGKFSAIMQPAALRQQPAHHED